MKTNLLLLSTATLILISLIAGTLYNSSSPGAKTGSPLDGATCVQCHSGSEVSSVEWITTDIPETGWVPGTTYTITATGSHSTAVKIGFEITAENANEKVGTFVITNEDRATLVNKKSAVTHKSAGNTPTDGVNTWEVSWTAPEVDKGDITFYAAFNAANGDGSTSGDEIFTSALTVIQDATTTDISDINELSLKIYPNPSSDFIFIQSPSKIQQVNLYSTNGSRIKTFSNINTSNSRLDLSGINKGMYIAKVQTSEGEFNRKIQKR